MSTALAGCIPLATSKFIDVFGRVEGFFLMLLIVLVGMALKAACKNMETYIAGHVLYWAGHIGVLYVTDVMAADITSLKNRMIIFTINGTPRIASTFAGPAIGDIFIMGLWRIHLHLHCMQFASDRYHDLHVSQSKGCRRD
jgi:MFS family permease